jgi:hypothetical protein
MRHHHRKGFAIEARFSFPDWRVLLDPSLCFWFNEAITLVNHLSHSFWTGDSIAVIRRRPKACCECYGTVKSYYEALLAAAVLILRSLPARSGQSRQFYCQLAISGLPSASDMSLHCVNLT